MISQKKLFDIKALIAVPLALFVFANPLFGSSEGLNFYRFLADSFGMAKGQTALLASLLTLLLFAVFAKKFQQQCESMDGDFTGPQGLSLFTLMDKLLDVLYSMAKEHCGKTYRSFFPLLAGLFTFILVSNLTGLIPGLPPATEDFSTNLALGLLVFLVYNVAGIKEHGLAYIKQFTGPVVVLAPLFLLIELVSHSTRPLSLAFRLLANIFCDHLLLGVFSGLVPLVLPSLLMLFGLLVAVIQSFVFTLLSSIYINMAISHDH